MAHEILLKKITAELKFLGKDIHIGMRCDLIGSNRKFSFHVFSQKLLNSVIAFSVKLSLFTT